MKRNQLILIALFTIGLFIAKNAHAQIDREDRKSQLESQKIAFITKRLNLDVAEAQKFWPVYNEFQQKREEIVKKRREIFQQIANPNAKPSKEELVKVSDEYIQLQVKESSLVAEYHSKFKEVLEIRKVVEYYKAEEKFKIWLLNEMKKRQGQGNAR